MGIRRVAAVVVLFTTAACTLPIVNKRLIYESPSGRDEVVVETIGLKPRLRLVLRASGRTQTLEWGGESYLRFVDVCWVVKRPVVGIYVDGQVLAYDLPNGNRVDSALVLDELRSQIISEYGLEARAKRDPVFYPFGWADTVEGYSPFVQRSERTNFK